MKDEEKALDSSGFEFIRYDLKTSWKYAIRALSAAENYGATDTATSIKEIIVELSRNIEFCESMESPK